MPKIVLWEDILRKPSVYKVDLPLGLGPWERTTLGMVVIVSSWRWQGMEGKCGDCCSLGEASSSALLLMLRRTSIRLGEPAEMLIMKVIFLQ